MKSTFRVLFFLKRDKVKKNGNMPIMVRITIDGKLAQFNTKLEVNPKNWSAKTGKVNGRGAEFTRMNEMLDSIKATLHRHYQTILERDSYVTAEKVRNVFLGKEEKAKTLLQVFSQHNEQYALKVGKTATQKTYTRYELTKNRLAEYIHNKYNVEDITFREINVVFIEGFYLFIRENYPCTHNTAMKFIQRFRTVVLFAHNLGLITFNPFGAYKLKFEYVERDFLEQAELDRIYQKTFASKRLEQVRDIFIFSCYTGLSYVDVCELTPENIRLSFDGNLWIIKKRHKTSVTETKIAIINQIILGIVLFFLFLDFKKRISIFYYRKVKYYFNFTEWNISDFSEPGSGFETAFRFFFSICLPPFLSVLSHCFVSRIQIHLQHLAEHSIFASHPHH